MVQPRENIEAVLIFYLFPNDGEVKSLSAVMQEDVLTDLCGGHQNNETGAIQSLFTTHSALIPESSAGHLMLYSLLLRE